MQHFFILKKPYLIKFLDNHGLSLGTVKWGYEVMHTA